MGIKKIEIEHKDNETNIPIRYELGLNDIVNILNELDRKEFRGVVWSSIRERKRYNKLEKAINKRMEFAKKRGLGKAPLVEKYKGL